MLNNIKIAIIGLGYVGLPLAIQFGKNRPVIGFDINKQRIHDLKNGIDKTLETTPDELSAASHLTFTNELHLLNDCNVYIVTVPTPIDSHNTPNLTPLIDASHMVGTKLTRENIVIFESTVYPGATEEICVPILEEQSGLIYNKDFFCGYSPERINPGDKEHRLVSIKKVTSGSTPEAAEIINSLYSEIIIAGTHKAPSIKVAEAAKVIENIQRDVNIALINELAILFNKLEIDTNAVLEAASTKWNFLHFKPGLVGGHCIGVDPYYLTYKAQEVGFHPEVILSGRRVNDGMAEYVASKLISLLVKKRIHIDKSNILIMGFSFKEDCPDIRNTKVIDIVRSLEEFNCSIDVYDPWVDNHEANYEYGINLTNELVSHKYDAIIIAVAHREFRGMKPDEYHQLCKSNHVIYDLKSVICSKDVDARL